MKPKNREYEKLVANLQNAIKACEELNLDNSLLDLLDHILIKWKKELQSELQDIPFLPHIVTSLFDIRLSDEAFHSYTNQLQDTLSSNTYLAITPLILCANHHRNFRLYFKGE